MANASTKPPLKKDSTRPPAPQLSFGGEWHFASKKEFFEIIVFVPFFGAKKKQLHRHVEMVNDLGYDAVVFDLKFDLDQNLFSTDSGFGIKHVWADQIEKILNEVPGRKIAYAFSNPCASAIEAIARRGATDVAGLICDSGPSGNLLLSMYNYHKIEQPITTMALRWAASIAKTLIWSPLFFNIVSGDMEKLPKDFAVMSIQGWKDQIITPDQIDLVFEPHSQIRFTKLSLAKAAHVNGLKVSKDEYVPPVQKFLAGFSTRI